MTDRYLRHRSTSTKGLASYWDCSRTEIATQVASVQTPHCSEAEDCILGFFFFAVFFLLLFCFFVVFFYYCYSVTDAPFNG